MGKGSRQEELLSLIDGLRRVTGVREVNSALANGSAGSKPEQGLAPKLTSMLTFGATADCAPKVG